jgi:hypothetical protein
MPPRRMLARLEHEEILGHSTYALTIRQADVHVRDFTEKAPMGTPNYCFFPLRDCLMRKGGVVFIISREWDGLTLLPGFLDSNIIPFCHMVPICVDCRECRVPKLEHDRGSVAVKCPRGDPVPV